MKYRTLGKTGWNVSSVGLGTWQVGGGWGKTFDSKFANRLLHTAFDQGVNFVDTADVYDGGLSEAAVGVAVRERSEKIYVATKCGRGIQPHVNDGYSVGVLRKFVEDSLSNSGLDRLDLIQLHCPPTEVYQRDEIFGLFENLKNEGKIAALGVSIERISEGITAMNYDIVSTIQVIFNIFRPRPATDLFPKVEENSIGIIARIPLASGLLTGKINKQTTFGKDDHRHFNREGSAFDKGETFSGVPLDKAFPAVAELNEFFKGDQELAGLAIRWILMHKQVSTVIPGASKIDQLHINIESLDLPQLSDFQMSQAQEIYERHIKSEVNDLW